LIFIINTLPLKFTQKKGLRKTNTTLESKSSQKGEKLNVTGSLNF